jgi:hypothetical protein
MGPIEYKALMADFKTHVTASSLIGVGYGAVAHFGCHLPLPSCVLAGTLCGLSGMLPDIDSGTGRPFRESMALAAAVVPMMLLDRLQAMGLGQESIVLVGGLVYFLIRFGLAALLKRFTVHRGMVHSIPAAFIAAELAFLLASGSVELRLFKAGGVLLGFIVHLALDEMYSVQWQRGRVQVKRSLGTALKVFGHGVWPNVSIYLKLAVLTFVAMKEPGWMSRVYQENMQHQVEQVAREAQQKIFR